MRYDPTQSPKRETWSALSEAEQIELVSELHRRSRIKLPKLHLHAALHVVVENQALLGDETPVEAALQRLTKEGLSRHDAIHAVASVLSGVIFEVHNGRGGGDVNGAYFREVAELTADKWLSQSED